eukprot:COSAG02_NODE_1755_length_11052_cov_67.877842_9_plen_64_part_00
MIVLYILLESIQLSLQILARVLSRVPCTATTRDYGIYYRVLVRVHVQVFVLVVPVPRGTIRIL